MTASVWVISSTFEYENQRIFIDEDSALRTACASILHVLDYTTLSQLKRRRVRITKFIESGKWRKALKLFCLLVHDEFGMDYIRIDEYKLGGDITKEQLVDRAHQMRAIFERREELSCRLEKLGQP